MISIAKFAKSKFFVPGFVIALVVIGWLILIWTQISPSEEPGEVVEYTADWSQEEDYVIKEVAGERFVENEKMGFRFKVPSGWILEIHDTTISLLSKELTLSTYGSVSPKELIEKEVCVITIDAGELGSNISEPHVSIRVLNEQISYLVQSPDSSDYYELITVDGHKGLKTKVDEQYYISVEVPVENKLYRFEVNNYSTASQGCIQEFDQFLKTVSIQ